MQRDDEIISVIDQPQVIKAILQYVGLWETRKQSPPSEYYADEQIPVYDCNDMDFPFEAYLKRHRLNGRVCSKTAFSVDITPHINPCVTPQPFNCIADFCPNNPFPYLATGFLLTHKHHLSILPSSESEFLSIKRDDYQYLAMSNTESKYKIMHAASGVILL